MRNYCTHIYLVATFWIFDCCPSRDWLRYGFSSCTKRMYRLCGRPWRHLFKNRWIFITTVAIGQPTNHAQCRNRTNLSPSRTLHKWKEESNWPFRTKQVFRLFLHVVVCRSTDFPSHWFPHLLPTGTFPEVVTLKSWKRLCSRWGQAHQFYANTKTPASCSDLIAIVFHCLRRPNNIVVAAMPRLLLSRSWGTTTVRTTASMLGTLAAFTNPTCVKVFALSMCTSFIMQDRPPSHISNKRPDSPLSPRPGLLSRLDIRNSPLWRQFESL